MTTPDQMAEYNRLEYARQMQADEMRRQMQADEMRRAEFNRQETQRAEASRQAARQVYDQCTNCRAPGGNGGLCPRCRDSEKAKVDGLQVAPALQVETSQGVFEESRRDPVSREAARQTYDQCTNCRGPGGNGGLCPRCRDEAGRILDSKRYENGFARAYSENFDRTSELKTLWERASEETSDYRTARSVFWELVNTDVSEEAQFVRHLLEAAGFTIGQSTAAPMLADEWDDPKKGRYDNARRLSLDHEVPQSRERQLSLDPSNIRFMLMDDNLRRGAHFGAGETPYDVCPGCMVPSAKGLKCQKCLNEDRLR